VSWVLIEECGDKDQGREGSGNAVFDLEERRLGSKGNLFRLGLGVCNPSLRISVEELFSIGTVGWIDSVCKRNPER
jgi:hypothetical protein